MPYRYREDIAIADAAFEAWGQSIEETFISASEAVLNTMVGNLEAIRPRQYRHFRVRETQPDMLLFQLLQELIYYKDAEQLLLRVQTVRIDRQGEEWTAYVEAAGEPINPERHELIVDVKAVTLHRFTVQQTDGGWRATVTVDV